MKFLLGILGIFILIAGISHYRTPEVGNISASEFEVSEKEWPDAKKIESFKELAEILKKEQQIIEAIVHPSDSDILSLKMTPEQYDAVRRASEAIASSQITAFPVAKNWDDLSNRYVYSVSAKALAYQFVSDFQKGNHQAAKGRLESLANLSQGLSHAPNGNLVGYIISLTVESRFLNISESILASSQKAAYSETMARFLRMDSKFPMLFESALVKEVDIFAQNVETMKKMGDWKAKYSDLDYVKKYKLTMAKFSLEKTPVSELRTFYDALPYCPMKGAAIDPSENIRSNLLKAIHTKFTCPFDPLRGKYASRILLAPAYVDFTEDWKAGNDIEQRKATLLSKIDSPTVKRRNIKK